MNRTDKLKKNAITSLLSRIAIMISGLILPRLILVYYGSETNGLVSSINQFLSIITFLDLGVGSVVQSVLYRPLAQKDSKQVSSVLTAARNYFKKIAYALLIYVIGLMIFYPLIVDSSFGFLSTGFLIFGLSLSLFGQYYFGIVNELLLNADQRAYVQLGSEIVVVILNLLASVFLITQGASIQTVKLVAGLIFLIRPVFLAYYVKKDFDISLNIELTEDPLPQKWSGMGQHVAYTIQNSTDIVILTLFSTLENVSVYSVYNMVTQAIRMVIASLTTGITSFFGDLLANDEIDQLNKYFTQIEWMVHTGVVYLYGMTAVLITPFVMIYTTGVEDIDYYAPVFSFLLVLAKAAYSLRTPYQSLIFSAGHFKETQRSSYIEAGVNIVLTLFMVNQFGLVGVTFGTIVSMAYRTVYLVVYISRNIIYRPVKKFLRHLFVDAITFGLMMGIGIFTMNFYQINNLIDWIIMAIILGIVFLVLVFTINLIFYKDIVSSLLNRMFKK